MGSQPKGSVSRQCYLTSGIRSMAVRMEFNLQGRPGIVGVQIPTLILSTSPPFRIGASGSQPPVAGPVIEGMTWVYALNAVSRST